MAIRDTRLFSGRYAGTELSDELWRTGESDVRESATAKVAITQAECADYDRSRGVHFPKHRIEASIDVVFNEVDFGDEGEHSWTMEVASFKGTVFDDVAGRAGYGEKVRKTKNLASVRLSGHGPLLIEIGEHPDT